MKDEKLLKWEISTNGWYPYCPYCKQESFYRLSRCPNCGKRLQEVEEDVKLMEENERRYDEFHSCSRWDA